MANEDARKEMKKKKRIRRAIFRFMIYGSLLIAGEVAFYTVTKIGRAMPEFISWLFQFQWLVDPRLGLDHIWNVADVPIKVLYGQASLWMFFVYGSIGLFGVEAAYDKIKNWHWIIRGSIYMVIILFMECTWGWILLGVTGYSIWYYEGVLSIFKYTSLAIAPMWFIVGLLSENLVRLIDKLTEVKLKLLE
ncbi:MAG: hypothetical protein GY754_01650 [bacterium]|nr:hypothetical protein [bacterium]